MPISAMPALSEKVCNRLQNVYPAADHVVNADLRIIVTPLPDLSKNRFAVMGRAGMDLYPDPPGTRTEDAARFVTDLGGSAANIAAALTRAGSDAALLTCVSDDAVGRFVRNRLKAHGIDDTHVRAVGGGARNSLALAESRTEDHQSVIYRNGAADFQMNTADVAIDYAPFAALVSAGTVFAAEPSRSAAFAAFDLARAAGTPVVFDIDYRPYSWPSAADAAQTLSRAGAAADVIVGNDEEFGFMAGDMDQSLSHARQMAGQGKLVIYKRGPLGSLALAGDDEIETPVFKVTALKPFGAGDAFLGNLLAALAKGATLPEALRRGTAAAAIVVSRVGCASAMPAPPELAEFMMART
jgi:5-dehydro-2-deoxygluconokinase